MNGDQLALVLAATIPAAITTVGGIWLARVTKGVRDKVSETHHQVTVNGHHSDTPTVLDRLAEVAEVAAEARDTAAATQAQLAEHLAWSKRETSNLWRAVWYAFRGHRERQELGTEDVPEQR